MPSVYQRWLHCQNQPETWLIEDPVLRLTARPKLGLGAWLRLGLRTGSCKICGAPGGMSAEVGLALLDKMLQFATRTTGAGGIPSKPRLARPSRTIGSLAVDGRLSVPRLPSQVEFRLQRRCFCICTLPRRLASPERSLIERLRLPVKFKGRYSATSSARLSASAA
mmetsp:Transcript_64752/g.115147  ORF Transcript_64752/g.115147 Transcript_64752/m.115147 type:complete len:166 (-) Transcript_64752:343-840(-)